MDTRFFAAALLTSISLSAQAADWDFMRRSPAKIEVIGMKSKPLVATDEKDGWAKVPARLAQYNAVVYMPTGSTNGVADITVTADGFLLLAANYDYQGNKEGSWDEEAWNERKFKSKGWNLLTKTELGGLLVKGDNRAQTVFAKQVRKGDVLRVRCNKYAPPYPILLSQKP